MVGSLKMNTTLEYSTRVVQEGDRRCKKSTLNDLAYLTPLRIPLMNPVPEFIDPVLGMKMIVFAKISLKRSFSIQFVPRDPGLSLFWMRSDWGVIFKYWNCVEDEISMFS